MMKEALAPRVVEITMEAHSPELDAANRTLGNLTRSANSSLSNVTHPANISRTLPLPARANLSSAQSANHSANQSKTVKVPLTPKNNSNVAPRALNHTLAGNATRPSANITTRQIIAERGVAPGAQVKAIPRAVNAQLKQRPSTHVLTQLFEDASESSKE